MGTIIIDDDPKFASDLAKRLQGKSSECRIIDPQEFSSELCRDELTREHEGCSRYIINANIKWKNFRRQDNGGIQLWRERILSSESLRSVPVIFLSFLSAEQCVKLSKGQDIIILFGELVKFLRLPPRRSFEDADDCLDELLGFTPSFRISRQSEALLSSWGMSVAHRSKLAAYSRAEFEANRLGNGLTKEAKKKQFLLIDDEGQFWAYPLSLIFNVELNAGNKALDVFLEKLNSDGVRKGALEGFKKLFGYINPVSDGPEQGDCPDLILLDLFLARQKEKHGQTKRLTEDSLHKVSGSRVLEALKELNPSIPKIMFTTSSRVWNYKRLSRLGVDDWWVKTDGEGLTRDEKIDSYLELESILSLMLSEPYPQIMRIWNDIAKAIFDLRSGKRLSGLSPTRNAEDRERIAELLEYSFHSLRLVHRWRNLARARARTVIKKETYYLYSAIVQQLGNIPEVIYGTIGIKNIDNGYLRAAYLIRNEASHALQFETYDISDVLTMFHFIILGLTRDPVAWNHLLPIKDYGLSRTPGENVGESLQKLLPILRYLAFFNDFGKDDFIRNVCRDKLNGLGGILAQISYSDIAYDIQNWLNSPGGIWSKKKDRLSRLVAFSQVRSSRIRETMQGGDTCAYVEFPRYFTRDGRYFSIRWKHQYLEVYTIIRLSEGEVVEIDGRDVLLALRWSDISRDGIIQDWPYDTLPQLGEKFIVEVVRWDGDSGMYDCRMC